MHSNSILIWICLGSFTGNVMGINHWTYDEEDHWSPLCKTGSRQSPIALSESTATIKEYLPFILSGYGKSSMAVLKNNGHSVIHQQLQNATNYKHPTSMYDGVTFHNAEVRLSTTTPPNIRGGGLPGTYILDHLHFHWQSEHIMANYRFPLELHLVHYNGQFGNLSHAATQPQGIAVLSVLFDLSPDDDEDFQPLIDIINKLDDSENKTKELSNFIVKSFIPRDKAGFYRYDGSLTTPGCNEGVIWTVFTSTLPVSKKQVKNFEELQTHEKTPLTKNYRSLQRLNGREVYLRISPIRTSNAWSLHLQSQLTLISFIVSFLSLVRN